MVLMTTYNDVDQADRLGGHALQDFQIIREMDLRFGHAAILAEKRFGDLNF
jgi:hypothetical protein